MDPCGFRRKSPLKIYTASFSNVLYIHIHIQGNEHVTHTYPDGREVYCINGIEQPRSHDVEERFIPPPPPPPEMRTDGFPPPPLITGPLRSRPSHHRTHSYEGRYNAGEYYTTHTSTYETDVYV